MNIRTLIERIQRIIDKNRNEIRGILLRQYPAYVLSDRVETVTQIPVFVFHDVSVGSLEPVVAFLAHNGYTTLTADEYYERITHPALEQQREVLLTFDDGHKSLYAVAYPILQRYGFNAVAYIVPGIVSEGDEAVGADHYEGHVCNWKQIREMHERGILDFQSHSMYHHSISIRPQVIDFVRPGLNRSYYESSVISHYDSSVVPLIQENGQLKRSPVLPYGTPLYSWKPRFAEAPAFRESRSVRQACVQHVDRFGGADYFRTSDWRRGLRAVLVEARQKDPAPGFESAGEQRRAILEDFLNSKHEIERRLPAKTVRHFCYPWFQGSALAAALSAEAGYVSNAWGSLLPNFVAGTHGPLPVARLSPTYIWRLPGTGRRPLRELLLERLAQIYNSTRPPRR